ncbi:hypothetical protein ABK040_011926 [Willaertia magna]
MLFKLGFHSKSNVEILLENEETCILENLLDEDDIIQEAKAHYGKLIDFLCKSENLTKMIDFITIEIPIEQVNDLKKNNNQKESEIMINEEKLQKRIYKYPRVAAEILSCDIEPIYTSIVNDKLLMTSLFDFILQEEEKRNVNLSNYWIRVVTCLVQRKPIEVHKFIMTQNEQFVIKFVNHIGIPGMDELLLKIISCELYDLIVSAETNRSAKQQLKLRLMDAKDNSDAVNIIKQAVHWWVDNGIEFKLIDKLTSTFSSDYHVNVTRILSEIIRRSLQYNLDITKLNPLAQNVLSDKVLVKLMDTLLANNQVLNEGISLLHTLIDTSIDLMDTDFDENLPNAIKVILSKLPDLVNLLKELPTDNNNTLVLTFGTLNPPLGETRLKVIEFLSSLYHIRCEPVEKALIECNVLNVVIDLFFKYEFNNLLHNLLLNIISFILSGDSQSLKKNLFVDCKIVERILKANKLNDQNMKEGNKMRKGYMGHLIIISNTIVTTANSDDTIQQMIKDIQGWKEFVDTTLSERNAIESRQMGSDDNYLHIVSVSSIQLPPLSEEEQKEKEEAFIGFDDEMEESDNYVHIPTPITPPEDEKADIIGLSNNSTSSTVNTNNTTENNNDKEMQLSDV